MNTYKKEEQFMNNLVVPVMSVVGTFLFSVGFVFGGILFSLDKSKENQEDFSVSSSNVNVVSPPSISFRDVETKLKIDSVGLYRGNNILIRVSKSGGIASRGFSFGIPGDKIVMGDWNGDGVSTPGILRNNIFYFIEVYPSSEIGRVVPIPNSIVKTLQYGDTNKNYLPVAGDWDGDGKDSLGIYEISTGTFYLTNDMSSAAPNNNHVLTISSSPANKFPIAGDWDGDGRDSVGFYDPSNGRVVLRNRLDSGPGDLSYDVTSHGSSQLDRSKIKVVTGDWANQGFDVPAVYDPVTARFFMRYNHGAPFMIYSFPYGTPTDDANSTPVSGTWVKITY